MRLICILVRNNCTDALKTQYSHIHNVTDQGEAKLLLFHKTVP